MLFFHPKEWQEEFRPPDESMCSVLLMTATYRAESCLREYSLKRT
jgi:hypothetical protein